MRKTDGKSPEGVMIDVLEDILSELKKLNKPKVVKKKTVKKRGTK